MLNFFFELLNIKSGALEIMTSIVYKSFLWHNKQAVNKLFMAFNGLGFAYDNVHIICQFCFVDDAKLNCNFERFEKCFFDNVKEGDDFEWGLGFVSTRTL